MNKGIVVAALLAVASAPAFASGPYDGVYQYGLSPAYYSVHQNGNQLLVVSLGLLPTDGTIEVTIGAYTVAPTTMGNWDYAMGFVNGNRARISGTGIYGACVTTSDVVMENGVVTATLVSAINTPFGTAQGVNCARLIGDLAAAMGPITLRKIF